MFALCAVITFAVGFVLALLGVDTGKVDLLLLGLFFVACYLLSGAGWPWRPNP